MDEANAWLEQARSDQIAAERLAGGNAGRDLCHAIAKYQQTVEKAVKAIVAELRGRGIPDMRIGPRHDVEPLVSAGPSTRARRSHDIFSRLNSLFSQNIRAEIRILDALVPRWPARGQSPRKNTEYPFQDSRGHWTYPAAQGVFFSTEVQQFRALSRRIIHGASQNCLGSPAHPADRFIARAYWYVRSSTIRMR